MDENEYVHQLEDTVRKFMEPISGVPFPIVIKALTGFKVLSFDKNSQKEKKMLERLTNVISLACNTANKSGIFTNRPNEVGNHIEPFVRDALISVGMKAEIPKTKSGKHKAAGYPDIYVEDIDGTPFYLECKTYNEKSIGSSFRAFYMSPSEDPKITTDAYHLLVSFEIEEDTRSGKRAYVPIHWRLYTLELMMVQVKHEFNASNKDMYIQEALIVEGYADGPINEVAGLDKWGMCKKMDLIYLPSMTLRSLTLTSGLTPTPNRWIYAGAYAPPFGTLLPSVATSYIPGTLSEIAGDGLNRLIWRLYYGE